MQQFNRYTYTLNSPIRYVDPTGHAAVSISFPDYNIQTSLGGVSYLGYVGILLINNKMGRTKYYEYGRYGDECGITRNVPIPDTKIGNDGLPTAVSLKKTLSYISKKIGKGSKLEGAYFPDADFNSMEDYAQEQINENQNPDRKEYNPLFNNCSHFCSSTLQSGGENSPFITNPVPKLYVEELQEGNPSIGYDPEKDQLTGTLYEDNKEDSGG